MNWDFLTKRFRGSFGNGHARFVLPTIVLEIEPDFVAGARLDSSARELRRIGVRELEPRTIEPLLNGANIANLEDFRLALRGVAEIIGNSSGRLGLLVPDGSVRVAILTFESLPDDPKQAESLVRWRMKENLPYPPEEAKLTCQSLWNDPGSVGMMVVAAKISMLDEYVRALGLKNAGPELILPVTVAILPLIPETQDNAQMLVHVCSGWVTTVVVKGTRLRSWRTKEVGRGASEDFARLVASEMIRVLASSRDHLQIEVDKVWLCARPPAPPEFVSDLSRAISKEVQCLALNSGVATALSAAEKTVFESVGPPIAGLIANLG
jgi:hypothetical protein